MITAILCIIIVALIIACIVTRKELKVKEKLVETLNKDNSEFLNKIFKDMLIYSDSNIEKGNLKIKIEDLEKTIKHLKSYERIVQNNEYWEIVVREKFVNAGTAEYVVKAREYQLRDGMLWFTRLDENVENFYTLADKDISVTHKIREAVL